MKLGEISSYVFTTKMDDPIVIKVVLVGDSGVGKSNLMARYVKDTFSAKADDFTIGVEFATKTSEADGRNVKLQIWDTAGQERFRTVSSAYYRGSKGVFVVYDITNKESFSNVSTWLEALKQHLPEETPIFLLGNKCDLDHARAVKRETAEAFALENNMCYVETSAKDDINIGRAFDMLVRSVQNN
jgi:small GTP-binding protein